MSLERERETPLENIGGCFRSSRGQKQLKGDFEFSGAIKRDTEQILMTSS